MKVVNANLSAEEIYEKRKAQQRNAAKRYYERRKNISATLVQRAQEIVNKLKNNGEWDTLDYDVRELLSDMSDPYSSYIREPLFIKLYGDNACVGDTVTLGDVVSKSVLGKAGIDKAIARWASRGIVIEYKHNCYNVLDSTYTIKALK